MTQALSLPGNTERVYLDVIAQSESNDEFWYRFGPNDRITNFESCGNTAFRETERATTANGSIGSITVDSNRNFIISGYVNTLQGCVETTVRESVNLEASITSTLTPRRHSGCGANLNCRIDVGPPRCPDDYGSKTRFLSTYGRLVVCG